MGIISVTGTAGGGYIAVSRGKYYDVIERIIIWTIEDNKLVLYSVIHLHSLWESHLVESNKSKSLFGYGQVKFCINTIRKFISELIIFIASIQNLFDQSKNLFAYIQARIPFHSAEWISQSCTKDFVLHRVLPGKRKSPGAVLVMCIRMPSMIFLSQVSFFFT